MTDTIDRPLNASYEFTRPDGVLVHVGISDGKAWEMRRWPEPWKMTFHEARPASRAELDLLAQLQAVELNQCTGNPLPLRKTIQVEFFPLTEGPRAGGFDVAVQRTDTHRYNDNGAAPVVFLAVKTEEEALGKLAGVIPPLLKATSAADSTTDSPKGQP